MRSRGTSRGRRLLGYWAAQAAGALIAAAILRGSLGNVAHVGATLPAGSQGQAFLWEAVLTFFLMFVIMSVATDTRAVGEAAAIAIGGTVGLDAMFGGPVTGASMNPARSLGPALVSGDLHALWLYVAAPLARRGGRRARVPVRAGCAADVSNVLFVCVANSGRSVMAERLFRRAAGESHAARSAGSAPGAAVHPQVLEALAELGIDASDHVPHRLDDDAVEWAGRRRRDLRRRVPGGAGQALRQLAAPRSEGRGRESATTWGAGIRG